MMKKMGKKTRTNPSQESLSFGNSRKPPKPFEPKDTNVDNKKLTKEERERNVRRKEKTKAFMGGEQIKTNKRAIQKESLRMKLGRLEERIEGAAELNVDREEFMLFQDAGYLEAEAGTLERTGKVTQKEVVANVATSVGEQVYKLDLELGPYHVDYTRNGNHMLLAGEKGHLAMMSTRGPNLVTEFHVNETVRDACFLHNESLFAVSQKKSLYIYDRDGVELHCIRSHVEPTKLSFLPYHFLLAVASNTGYLKFQDVSTGNLVSEHRTRLGACNVMAQNSHNGVMHCGHHNGLVTLWSPAISTPLVKLLTHRGPVSALTIDPSGRYMASAGPDSYFKIWDLRMYKETHSYLTHRPVTSLAISQRGLLAVGFGSHLQVWRDAMAIKAKAPYMRHELPTKAVNSMCWRPFEDVLGIGHDQGFESVVIPGAGEPNYDALEANPFESKKERREAEVHRLLDKLSPETIALDQDFIGTVDKDPEALREERKALAAENLVASETKEKKRMRGRSKIGAKLKRKRKNIIDAERVALQSRLEKERAEKSARRAEALKERGVVTAEAIPPPAAIGRFFAKSS